MRNNKRMWRLTALVLALCLAFSLLPNSVQAVGPALPEEEPESIQTGRPASLIHYDASTGSLVIGCLEDGTQLTVLASVGGFYRIDCYDMKGYIAKSQVVQKEDQKFYVNCQEDSSETKYLDTYTAQDALSLKGEIRAYSMNYLGVRYVSGGTTPRGFDCCGFTQYLFRGIDVSIHRTVASQLQDGVIISKNDLQCGDLVFFQNTTGWGHFASHVGMYIGNNQIIHAGNGGVGIANLDDPYFTYHYMCARRVILTDLTQEAILPTVGINQNINSSYWRESSQTQKGSGNFFVGTLA